MRCVMHDNVQAEDCEEYQKHDGLHCFSIKICAQASKLCVKLGSYAGHKLIIGGFLASGLSADWDLQEELIKPNKELEKACDKIAACIMTIMSGGPDSMMWMLATAVIELLGTKLAKEHLPDFWKMPSELGALLHNHIEKTGQKPDHLEMIQVESESYKTN